ncbi:MAG: hypothetical protein QMD85_00295, partial [Candidatus Aenigmarchaeota archaeon]|nr:hypothetical protein [Candidatus Aenigmarchaeota archaeon]
MKRTLLIIVFILGLYVSFANVKADCWDRGSIAGSENVRLDDGILRDIAIGYPECINNFKGKFYFISGQESGFTCCGFLICGDKRDDRSITGGCFDPNYFDKLCTKVGGKRSANTCLLDCTGTEPIGESPESVAKGSKSYKAGDPQTSFDYNNPWTYDESIDVTNPPPCKWKCNSGFRRERDNYCEAEKINPRIFDPVNILTAVFRILLVKPLDITFTPETEQFAVPIILTGGDRSEWITYTLTLENPNEFDVEAYVDDITKDADLDVKRQESTGLVDIARNSRIAVVPKRGDARGNKVQVILKASSTDKCDGGTGVVDANGCKKSFDLVISTRQGGRVIGTPITKTGLYTLIPTTPPIIKVVVSGTEADSEEKTGAKGLSVDYNLVVYDDNAKNQEYGILPYDAELSSTYISGWAVKFLDAAGNEISPARVA